MAKPITRGGIPTPVYNRMKANQAGVANVKKQVQQTVQSVNATALKQAQYAHKNAATKGQQNIISGRIKRLEKRPVR